MSEILYTQIIPFMLTFLQHSHSCYPKFGQKQALGWKHQRGPKLLFWICCAPPPSTERHEWRILLWGSPQSGHFLDKAFRKQNTNWTIKMFLQQFAFIIHNLKTNLKKNCESQSKPAWSNDSSRVIPNGIHCLTVSLLEGSTDLIVKIIKMPKSSS